LKAEAGFQKLCTAVPGSGLSLSPAVFFFHGEIILAKMPQSPSRLPGILGVSSPQKRLLGTKAARLLSRLKLSLYSRPSRHSNNPPFKKGMFQIF
jgi:hypothetical protein